MKAYGWFGLALLVVSELCLWLRIEPIYSWFYCFAWWSYILLADNLLLRLTGRSLIASRRRELARMLPLSVFIWLVFEAYNLVLRNWGYDGVPTLVAVRWGGYSVAFATVLPGIFVTADLLGYLLFGAATVPPSEAEPAAGPRSRPDPLFLALGVLLTVAPLVWPRYFFPAVWIGPILLLDPLLERLGVRSLSLSLASGDRRRVWSLLAGGCACGLLWEFWNFWAGGKWIYSIPFFGQWKLFEMPVLGFLGSPPLPLEWWILYRLLSAALERAGSTARAVAWIALAAFCLSVFSGIDRHTVRRFAAVKSPAVRTVS